ncbi:phenylacetic acid degradation protein, partial [Mycobacterium sp. ITM-2017-0098]
PEAGDIIAASPEQAVTAISRPLGRKNIAALGQCELTLGSEVIATATVRSFYITVPADLAAWPDEPAGSLPGTGLADL